MLVVVKTIKLGAAAAGSNMKRVPRAELKGNQHDRLGKERGEAQGSSGALSARFGIMMPK